MISDDNLYYAEEEEQEEEDTQKVKNTERVSVSLTDPTILELGFKYIRPTPQFVITLTSF